VNTVVQILDTIAEEAERAERSDGQLLDLFVRLRDEEAFAAVVRRHGPMVLGVCRRILRNAADADDAFQAAFLVLARKAGTIGTRGLLAQWLYGVASNTARKLRQSNARRATHETPLAEASEPQANTSDAREELLAILDEELTRLPERYRAVIVLCDLEGLTRREAAKKLACPEGTVAGRLARARDLLAARLTARGVVPAAGLLAAVLTESASLAVSPAAVAGVVRTVSVSGLANAAARGLISPRVAETTEGVLKSMFATKLRVVAAVAACCGLALACTVGAIHFANAQPTPEPKLNPLDLLGLGDKPAPEKTPAKTAPAEKKLLTAIPLKKLAAKAAAEKLLKLLPAAVTVAAARDENTLLVYATAKGTDDVRLVLRTLGEELPKEAAKPAEPKKYTFRMKNVPWGDVLDWYAKETGLTMITTLKPTGTFTFNPPEGRQFTLEEITDLLNEAMAQQKFILIRRHMTFFIHPADERIDPKYVPLVELSELSKRGKTEIVLVILPLKKFAVADVKDELKKLLTPFGSIIVLEKQNSLLIQDTVGNINRIREVLEPLEKQPPMGDPIDPRKLPAKPKTYSIKFQKTPWKDVFTWYATESGLTRVGDSLPTGTFTFTSPVPENPQEIFSPALSLDQITDYINESLLAQKWLLVRGETTFIVVPADEKVDPKWVRRIKPEELDSLGRTELVEVMIQPERFTLGEVDDAVKQMVGPFGHLRYLTKSQIVEVCGTATNVRAIVKKIRELDEAAKPKEK
jgi:RNA polymerase sigma factor (sigma-70 family)